MNTSAEQLAFWWFCIGVVGILGNGLIGWELGKKGFYQLGLEGPRNKKVTFALCCFFLMVFWQSTRKLESPLSSWKYGWLPVWGILVCVLSRHLIPRSVRLYFKAKRLHETTYTGDWQSAQPEVPIEQIRSNPQLQKAEALYQQALEVQRSLSKHASRDAERTRHQQNEAVTFCQLALLHLQRREFEKASENSQEAVRLAERLFSNTNGGYGTGSLLSDAIFRDAEADQAMGEFAIAREKYKRSLSLSQQLGDTASVSVTERRLAQLSANRTREKE
jgi:tetratricopeptide (TPR) repeat protein